MLYPQEYNRYDPSMNSYSPLAQFSSQTLREHSETIDKLNLQLETITRRLHELSVQESEDQRRYTRMLDALQREESDIVALLGLNRTRIDELQQATAAEVARRREESDANAVQVREFEADLNSQMKLEGDLLVVKQSIEEKLHVLMERRNIFAREFRHGMTILEAHHQDAKAASVQAEYFVQGARHSTQTLPVSGRGAVVQSPRREATAPWPPARPVSPPRGAASSSGASMTTGSLRVAASPPRQTLASAVFGGATRAVSPVRAGYRSPLTKTSQQPSVPTPPPPPSFHGGSGRSAPAEPPIPFEELVRVAAAPSDPFRKLSEQAERLHAACRNGRFEEIRDVLRFHQSVVYEAHPVTGDTALHVLCGAPVLSIDAIKEVCLIDAALLQLANKQGLLPFHIACLNVMDNDHKVKMFMVTDLCCNPNQLTALGETVAHLCAKSDYHHAALRCVVERMRVDPSVRALTINRQGVSVHMTAWDIAKEAREQAKYNAEFLADFFRTNGLS